MTDRELREGAQTMRVIGYDAPGALDGVGALRAAEAPIPALRARDVLVEVAAVSVNPVDVKVRAARAPIGEPGVLGYDAVGVVRAVGSASTLFAPGDRVWAAGDITRAGTNADFWAVDERIVGRTPRTLAPIDAAALPLTTITAWEMLFDSFGLVEGGGAGATLLVIGGAGGVGSILIQLAKALTALRVVATASRPETVAWVESMGADVVVDHRGDLAANLAAVGETPTHVAALTATDRHFASIVEAIAPRGHICMIDDPGAPPIEIMKPKALTLSWEFMFTRSMFETADMIQQHRLLTRVAQMVDDGVLKSTANKRYDRLDVDALTDAHAHQESGRAIGKTVLPGLGAV